MKQLLLDERIFFWVFIPIIYVTVMLNLLRAYYSIYSQYTTTKNPNKTKSKIQAYKDGQLVSKCSKLALRHAFITEQAFNCRMNFLCNQENGYLKKASQDRQPQPTGSSMMNLNGMMMEGMKGNMMIMATMMPAMAWINYFFAGFLLGKVPFSLTQKFRSMTQSGVDMDNLGVSYISGVSLYFLIMYGLNQINALLLEEGDAQVAVMGRRGRMAGMSGPPGAPMMNPMMGGGGMNAMTQPNASNTDRFKPQKQSLQLVHHHFAYQNSYKHALARLNSTLK